jgi:hypothetical protein
MLYMLTSVSTASPHPESSEAYPSIKLNDRWRVIVCRDGIQWILQHRNRAETVSTNDWRGRSYFRTKEALIRSCDRFCGLIDPSAIAVLEALPERIESPSTFAGQKPASPTPPRSQNSRKKPPGSIAAEWEAASMAAVADEIIPKPSSRPDPKWAEECHHFMPKFLCRRCCQSESTQ